MITLRWAPYPDANIAGYKVYRSFIGFIGSIPSGVDIDGKTLELKVNGGPLQTFTFNNIDTVIDTINDTIVGAEAFPSISDANKFIVRSQLRDAPGSVEIAGGTGLLDLGLTTRIISEKSEDILISSLAALEDPSEALTYDDLDGVLQDWYAISTISNVGSESAKTPYRQAIQFTGPLCVMEGIISDLQGLRLVDEEVKAKIIKIPQESPVRSSISKDWVSTLSGPDGRFSLPLLQGTIVKFEVPVLKFSRNIRIPYKAYEFVTDLLTDLDYRYPLD